MVTAMLMEWPESTLDHYNRVMSSLGLDANPPDGAIFHVAGFGPNGMRVLDIWESQQAFERFQQERLNAVIQKVGIPGQPKIQFFPVHNMYTPNLDTIKRMGASSLPAAV